MPFIGADQTNELAMAVQDGPDPGALADRRLAGTTRHGHRKQAAPQHGLLDLGDHLQMVGRPRQMERERKVRVAEGPEIGRGSRLALRVHDGRQFTDVAAGQGDGRIPCSRPIFQLLIRVAVRLRFGRMPQLDQPRDVAQ